MTIVLVTGASGFLGKSLAPALASSGYGVRAAYRTHPVETHAGVDAVIVGSTGAATDWTDALQGVAAVVHLAGPAHSKYSDDHLRREIAEQTTCLAAQAEQAGVARFIYVSSIKAAASESVAPLRPSDPPAPVDGYGRAKLEAEAAVMSRRLLRPVVLRPPLVCAADAKANFASLLRLANSPWPLPFAGLSAKRSLLGRDSFVRAVVNVLGKPDGVSGVFHLAEQPSLSVGEMVRALREGMGRTSNQFALPGLGAVLPAALRESLVVDDAAFLASYGSYVDGEARDMLRAIGAAWTMQ